MDAGGDVLSHGVAWEKQGGECQSVPKMTKILAATCASPPAILPHRVVEVSCVGRRREEEVEVGRHEPWGREERREAGGCD